MVQWYKKVNMIHDFMSDKATTGFVSCPLEKRKKEREKKFFFTFYFSPWWVGVQFRVICLKLDNLFPGKYVIRSMLSYHCSATIARFSNGKSFKAKACDLKDKRGMQGEIWRKGGVGVSFCYFVHLGVVLWLRLRD